MPDVGEFGLQDELLNFADILFLGVLKGGEGHVDLVLILGELEVFNELLFEVVLAFLILELGLDVDDHLPLELRKVADFGFFNLFFLVVTLRAKVLVLRDFALD